MTVPIPLLSDDPRRLQIVSPSLQIGINQSDQMLQYNFANNICFKYIVSFANLCWWDENFFAQMMSLVVYYDISSIIPSIIRNISREQSITALPSHHLVLLVHAAPIQVNKNFSCIFQLHEKALEYLL